METPRGSLPLQKSLVAGVEGTKELPREGFFKMKIPRPSPRVSGSAGSFVVSTCGGCVAIGPKTEFSEMLTRLRLVLGSTDF